jgi:pimeloyl-ACP methyl ester carboxylesterase
MMRNINIATTECEVPYTAVAVPLWREVFWWREWLQLRSSPVYRGVGLPRGDGEPIVLVPGFLSSDAHLTELEHWLTRMGYRVHTSGIGHNADCPDVLLGKLLESVEFAFETTAQRVQIVGHSLGGTLARAAAVRRPDLVARVVTLGSPIREVRAHPFVIGIARLAESLASLRDRAHGDHAHDGSCACTVIEALAQPFPPTVARTAIYTPRDGVLDWRSTMDEDARMNIEVDASHVGLPFNAEVYEVIAHLLAASDIQSDALAA